MKYTFPNQNRYLQTNRSDRLGTLWSSFNLDFQSKLNTMRLANKLVTTTTGASVGLTSAFDFYRGGWYATCGDRIYLKSGDGNIIGAFGLYTFAFSIGSSTTRFDITNPTGTTARYTYDGTGTNPGITALTIPVGAAISINAENFDAANNVVGTVTGSGNNYFEVTNAAVVPEVDKTIGTGMIQVADADSTYGTGFDPQKSDTALFNDKIWFTEKTKLLYYNQAQIITAEQDLTDSLHKLTYLPKRDRLYYTNDKTDIKSIDTAGSIAASGDYFLDIGTNFGEITTMVSDGTHLFIGTLMVASNISEGSQGSILIWDGISAQVSNSLILPTAGVLAMCVNKEIPYAIDTEGRILKYTGYSFEEIARLPINRTLLTNANVTVGTGRFVHFNGMEATKDNTILVNINNLNSEDDTSSEENIPSGVWELDLDTGNFTHKHSFTLKAYNTATTTDYGQNRVANVGAIKVNPIIATTSNGRSTLLASATYYTDATTSTSAIFIDSPDMPDTDYEAQKRGYFISTWFESPEIESTFTKIWAVYKRFENSTDKIIFKYRLTEEDPIDATITWTSTSTFTTTTDISDYVGYEAEIIQGTGSGACTNISSITEAGGTYTATIDTAITGVTGTAKARFQKWKKIYPEASGTVKSYTEMPFDATNTRIQIKGILEWTGDGEFTKAILMSDEDIISNL